MPTARSEAHTRIATNLRDLRTASGKTQQQLATHLGVTFRQVQKYESGTNRISAGTLFDAAQFLGVPVETFFPAEDWKG